MANPEQQGAVWTFAPVVGPVRKVTFAEAFRILARRVQNPADETGIGVRRTLIDAYRTGTPVVLGGYGALEPPRRTPKLVAAA